MARPRIQDRTVLDWLRIVVPYPYDKTKKIPYLSYNNNPLNAYLVDVKKAKSLLYIVANAMGLDGQNYTNASLATLNALKRAHYGYDGTYVFGHARVMYKEIKSYLPLSEIKMGMCIDLSSHALRDIENSRGFENWSKWLDNFHNIFPQAKYKRVDLASDFFHDLGLLTPSGLKKLAVGSRGRLLICTRVRKGRNIESIDFVNHKMSGQTFEVGVRRGSSYYLRAYDKFHERLNEHGDAWLKHNRIKHWTRYELEIHERIASHVIGLLRSGVSASQIWLDLIRKLMYIQASSDDVKKGRVKSIETQVFDVKNKIYKTKVVIVPKFWAEFIDNSNVPKFDYTGKTPSWTYDKHMHWFGSAVMPSFTKDLLAQIMQGCDVNTYLNQIFSQSLSKLQPADVDDIIHWAKSLKVSKFKQAKNEFDFTSMLKSMSDRFTGMIGQRLYDLRNQNRFTEDDLITHEIEEYENFVKEYGLANEIVRLKQKGIIQ